MSVDSIGNFLTIIRNGTTASKQYVVTPYSTINFEIGRILLNEGFIKECALVEEDNGQKQIKVSLKYVDGESAIHEIKRISTPGRRFYAGSATIKPVIGGLGISILTTNQGLLTNKKAKQLSVGGEIICTVW
ncbi:MAG: 30S ribosomal protein S8 [Candidatus Babeliales bacterium]